MTDHAKYPRRMIEAYCNDISLYFIFDDKGIDEGIDALREYAQHSKESAPSYDYVSWKFSVRDTGYYSGGASLSIQGFRMETDQEYERRISKIIAEEKKKADAAKEKKQKALAKLSKKDKRELYQKLKAEFGDE